MIKIRKSRKEDIERILKVYDDAKQYMRREGNMAQWVNGYPGYDVITKDILEGNHYLIEDNSGNLLMVFSFIIGRDPTYDYIEGGEWLDDSEYGTIHRAASSGMRGGMMKNCVNYCFTLIDNIRVDTHSDNKSMQNALAELGFIRCGIIYLKDGSQRLAYQKILRNY